jgi:23S rRNA pseudouridine1911/1915/1917 synthase
VKSYTPVDETLVEVSIEVPQGDQGMRLDQFIQRHISRLSRTRVRDIIHRGVIDRTGKSAKPAQRVRVGEVFSWRRQVEPEELRPMDLRIIHEDDEVLGLNKPGDLVVHPTAKVWRNTVTAWLRDNNPTAKIAHRLDRETSGVLVCGKGPGAQWLKERFRLGQAKKTYWAIVKGEVDFEEQRVDLPLMLDETSPLKVKMCVDKVRGLSSVTHVRVLERLRGHTLVECRPETGRQHQIRVHLFALGFPLLGDKLYGVSEAIFKESADHGSTLRVRQATGAARHMLHAFSLEVKTPRGEELVLCAPLHDDMRDMLQSLRLKAFRSPFDASGLRLE